MAPTEVHPFKGRTVAVVNDLSLKEQWYLYMKTRQLKEAIKARENLGKFRLRNKECAVYTIFMEDSTRTKESFRNAAEFHGLKVNVFDAKTSSFQKSETVTDTIKMLCGYSIGQSIFVIRSKMEGVCTWLEEAIGKYTAQRGYPRASFVNAGDGRHEHPSQEFLDEFTFLEHKGWDCSSIHLTLLGDLYHGRTIHSKVDGLRLYDRVEVDLVAPAELALPAMYEDRMVAAGYVVRKFASIDEYLAQEKVSKIWYFTRLQLERMGDKVLDKSAELRQAVTMRREFLGKLPPNTKFFHPLPRDARHPTLPFWLDNSPLNGWDQQSQNGYFTRIVLLGMLGGHFGDDCEAISAGAGRPRSLDCGAGAIEAEEMSTAEQAEMKSSKAEGGPLPHLSQAADFIKEIPLDECVKEGGSAQAGLVPITEGVVIENLAKGQSVEQIWGLMYMVRSIMCLEGVGGQGVYREAEGDVESGFISVPNFDSGRWDTLPLKKLAAVAPGSTINVVQGGNVTRRFQLQVPPRIYNLPNMSCKNPACVSNPINMQHEVPPYFVRAASRDASLRGSSALAFTCKYCESLHGFWQIWDYKYGEDLGRFTMY